MESINDDDQFLVGGNIIAFERRIKIAHAELDEIEAFSKEFWPYDVFPALCAGQLVYEVSQLEAVGSKIDVLELPDGVTIKPMAGVREIDWQVRVLRFGRNATIDLSSRNEKPATPRSIATLSPQAPVGVPGAQGNPGATGSPGQAGVALTLRGLERIEGDGTLWVRTDGGPGGDGGEGGVGQQGGAKQRRLWARRAQPGGAGGNGGKGGRGGDTSAVRWYFKSDPNLFRITCSLARDPAPSSRPSIPDGEIAIFGAGGLGGEGGAGGASGLRGDGSGNAGEIGQSGAQGENGGCGQCEFFGPSDQLG